MRKLEADLWISCSLYCNLTMLLLSRLNMIYLPFNTLLKFENQEKAFFLVPKSKNVENLQNIGMKE